MSFQKILRTGHSLAVTIPADLVKVFGLKPGDTVKVIRDLKQPLISYHFSGTHQLSLASQLGKKPPPKKIKKK